MIVIQANARYGCLMLALLAVVARLPAEVRKVTLPADFADYALHPQTGDLAALDAPNGGPGAAAGSDYAAA